jgi:hypothetical protein
MQAVPITLIFIIWDGQDGLGADLKTVIMRSKCLNSLQCANKQGKDELRKGMLVDYSKEAAFHFSMQLVMAGIAAAMMEYDCVVLGLDSGPEAVGAGKGQK